MAWRMGARRDLSSLRNFLSQREWQCAVFASRMRDMAPYSWVNGESFTLMINEEKLQGMPTILEALMLTRSGLVLPILYEKRSCTLDHNSRLKPFFHRYSRRLHSIMGLKSSVIKIENLFENDIRAKVDYFLMTLDLKRTQLSPNLAPPSVEVRTADLADADALYDIQRQYELEEVFLNPDHFDERRCRSLLRKSLKKQVIYLAEEKGVPIAKAGTNARGFLVDQIGGVFTLPSRRRERIGTLCMEALLKDIRQTKKMATLFVKQDNPAALALYHHLGFTTRTHFRITYYTRPA